MITYNEVSGILNRYSYSENDNVFDVQNNKEVLDADTILKIKSTFFVNEYILQESEKLRHNLASMAITFYPEYFDDVINRLYSELYLKMVQVNETGFADSVENRWVEFLAKHRDSGIAYLRYCIQQQGQDLTDIEFYNVDDEQNFKNPTISYIKTNLPKEKAIKSENTIDTAEYTETIETLETTETRETLETTDSLNILEEQTEGDQSNIENRNNLDNISYSEQKSIQKQSQSKSFFNIILSKIKRFFKINN